MDQAEKPDQPAITKPITPPPAAEPVDRQPRPRESFSLALRPRYRTTGTDRYNSAAVAGSELIKIPFTFRAAAAITVPDNIKPVQDIFDAINWGEIITEPNQVLESTHITPYSTTVDTKTDLLGTYITDQEQTVAIADGWWSGLVTISHPQLFVTPRTYTFEVTDGKIDDSTIRLAPPLTWKATPPFPQTTVLHFGTQVHTAENSETYFIPTVAANAGSYDIHTLLENNSTMFTQYEAYSISDLTVALIDADNWLRSSAQLYTAYRSDPHLNQPLSLSDTTYGKRYQPRFANMKFFTAGHNNEFVLPTKPGKFFTLETENSEKRFTSPGVIDLGVISSKTDNYTFALTLTAKIDYYVQTLRSTAPATGRTLALQLPVTGNMDFKSADRFLPVVAQLPHATPAGTYQPLQVVALTITLPNGIEFHTSLPKFTVADGLLSFRVVNLEYFDCDFTSSISLPFRFSYSTNYFYFIGK